MMKNLHKSLQLIAVSHCRPLQTTFASMLFLMLLVPALFGEVAESESSWRPTNQSGTQSNAVERVKVLRQQAHDLVNQNKLEHGAAILKELISLYDAKKLPNNRSVGNAFADVATSLMPTREYNLLEQVFVRGIKILENSHDSQLGDLLTAQNNLAAMYYEGGDYQSGDKIYSSIVYLAEVYDEEIDLESARIFLAVSEIYARAGHTKAVAILYGQVHRYMQNQEISLETRSAWLVKYANALVADGQYDKTLEIHREALEVADRLNPPNQEMVIAILASTGNIALKKKDYSTAERYLDRARRLVEESGLQDSTIAGGVYYNLALLYSSQRRRDKYTEAAKFADASLKITARVGGTSSSDYALALDLRAQLADEMGEFETANRYYRESINVFEKATHYRKQDFAACLSDYGFFLLAHGNTTGAIAPFERAAQVLQAVPNLPQIQLANALSNLATAHFKAGNYPQANQRYWQAIELRTSTLSKTMDNSDSNQSNK